MNGIAKNSVVMMTLGLALCAGGCDEPTSGGAIALRGIGTGGITFNTDDWVAPTARDVYEYTTDGEWHTNSFGFVSRLKKISYEDASFGLLETDPSVPPDPADPRVSFANDGSELLNLWVTDGVAPPQQRSGAELIGLELVFDISGAGGGAHVVTIRITDHVETPEGGEVFDFKKSTTGAGAGFVSICGNGLTSNNFARVYRHRSIDGVTGDVDYESSGRMHHIACLSSAPGKASTFGITPHNVSNEAFELANRVIRADFCGDGHPYTFPGNPLAILHNAWEPMTLAQAIAADENELEALWNHEGVLCVDTTRVDGLLREDIVCPVKKLPGGEIRYNWTPPSCDGFVDPNPAALRFFSKTTP